MIKNLFAAVGFAVLLGKGYEFYVNYQKMKKENDYWQRRNGEDAKCDEVQAAANVNNSEIF